MPRKPYHTDCTQTARLLERDEARRVGGTEAWSAVQRWLVAHRELAEVVSDHLSLGAKEDNLNACPTHSPGHERGGGTAGAQLHLDFDGLEDLAVVHTDDGADHLGDDDHVTQVSLDERGLLVFGSSLLLQ